MKLNLRGQPYPKRQAAAPKPGQFVHHEDSDQGYLSQVGRGLDPSTVDTIMQAANTGDTAQMCALSETIDDRSFAIGAALDTRRAAIAATPWHLVPGDENDTRAEEIATAAEQMLRASHPTNDLLTFGQMVQLELGSALLPGFAAPEIVWGKGGADILGYLSIPQKHFTFVNSRVPKLVTTNQPNGIDLLPNKHVLHWHRAKGGSPTRGGLIRACAWIRCFESVNIKDLLRFVERYGMPFLVAQVDEQSWQSERTVLRSIVRNFGPDGGAVISKNAELNLLQASNNDGEIYFKLLSYLAQAAEKLILGQTATSGDGGGWSNDGAQTMVRLDIRDSDCAQISETVYARLLVPWVAWNYGPDAPVPTQAYDIEEAKDTQAEATVIKTLDEAGWELDPDQVEKNTGYKVTRKAAQPLQGTIPLRAEHLHAPGNALALADDDIATPEDTADLALSRYLRAKGLRDWLGPLQSILDDTADLTSETDFRARLTTLVADLPALAAPLDSSGLEELLATVTISAHANGQAAKAAELARKE